MQPTAHSPELIFHIIKCWKKASALLSVDGIYFIRIIIWPECHSRVLLSYYLTYSHLGNKISKSVLITSCLDWLEEFASPRLTLSLIKVKEWRLQGLFLIPSYLGWFGKRIKCTKSWTTFIKNSRIKTLKSVMTPILFRLILRHLQHLDINCHRSKWNRMKCTKLKVK